MSMPDLQSKQYPLEVLTENYVMKCIAEPMGMLMTYLDSPDRTNMLFKNITMTGVAPDSTLGSINIKELWVQRREIIAINLDEENLAGAVQKLPAKETLRIFVPRFVIQGTLTHGEDTRLGDMFEVMKGTWAAMTDVKVFPLTAVKHPVFRSTPFLLLNKEAVRFYEAVEG